MLGWLFLALGLGAIGYVLFTSAGAAFLSSLTGLSIEPLTGSTLWTDWLTWSITDFYGLCLLGSMALLVMVLAINIASGDVAR